MFKKWYTIAMNKGEFKNLKSMFDPASIAVVGASLDEHKIGNIVVRNIERSGYEGVLYLINPKFTDSADERAFVSYSELPEVPDLAVVATPAATIPQLLEEIGKKGTKSVLIFAAGFKEIGPDGDKLEKTIKEIAKKYSIQILGPNCLGFYNFHSSLNATFGMVPNSFGNIRFISQSGAVATSLFDWAAECETGFSEFITIGNKVNTAEHSILKYWDEQKTGIALKNKQVKAGLSPYRPIGLYLESIADGKELMTVLKKITKKEPVIVIKPGRSSAAASAMRSHTGALAGDDQVFSAAMEQSGAIRVDGVEDMQDLLKAFSFEKAPEGPNVGIVSNAGGPAVITTDFVESCGLKLAPLGAATQRKLKKFLPREAAFHNPVDVLGDAPSDRYAGALESLLVEKKVDVVIVILTPQIMTEIERTADIIVNLSKKYKKPIFCAFMGGMKISDGEKILDHAKIPSFRYPERAVKAIGQMWRWKKYTDQKTVGKNEKIHVSESSLKRIRHFVERIRKERDVLSGFESNEIFNEAGIVVPKYALVSGYADAREFVHRFEFPVSLKIISPNLTHKTDIGGVVLDIKTGEELTAGMRKLEKIASTIRSHGNSTGIMIQKYVPHGVEVIVGVKTDLNFGKILLIGAGGIYAELLGDRKIIVFPFTKEELVSELHVMMVGKILTGFRGQKYAFERLVHLVRVFCAVVEGVDEFKEIEINPIIVSREDAFAVDGRAFI
jgi:acetyltransferase